MIISTKITQMQLRYQRNSNVIQSNRSWFQQNFLKFDKHLYKNPKIRR